MLTALCLQLMVLKPSHGFSASASTAFSSLFFFFNLALSSTTVCLEGGERRGRETGEADGKYLSYLNVL